VLINPTSVGDGADVDKGNFEGLLRYGKKNRKKKKERQQRALR
jgi:hypothetical protein